MKKIFKIEKTKNTGSLETFIYDGNGKLIHFKDSDEFEEWYKITYYEDL